MKGKWAAVAGAAVVVAAVAFYLMATGRPQHIEASGTVEARNIRVGSKVGGRIAEVLVREGDRVTAGQLLVRFEDDELRAALEQARANYEKLAAGYRPEEIAEARAAAAAARAEWDRVRTGYRTEEVAQAQAEVERARADAVNAETSFRRAQQLYEEGVWARQVRDDAEAVWKMAAAVLRRAEERLAELTRGFRPEEIAQAEARWGQAEAVRQRVERGFRSEDIEQARAALAEAEARWTEREVRAPANAVVEVMDVRPGDLLAPNETVAKLLERDQIYVRIYVPETEISRVRLGQPAEVRVDSFPERVFQATVEQINQEAEFLPRNVQTRAERVHQVFGVKLRVDDPEGVLRAGIAADVVLPLER